MKVEHIHTIDHTPGFKGHLYKLPNSIKPTILQYITRDVPIITTGRAKATNEGIAAVDLFAEQIRQLLKAFRVDAAPITVPDEEIVAESVEDLLQKYSAT